MCYPLYGYWELDTINSEIAAGITLDYVGFQAEASVLSVEGGIKINIPYTDKSLFIGAGGNIGAIGLSSYYKDGKIKIGVSALIGGSVTFGIE